MLDFRLDTKLSGKRDESMQQLRILGIGELAQHADKWNALWKSSETRQPAVTAEGIELWCKSFATEAEFSAAIVEDGDRFVVGLPLVADRLLDYVSVYLLPVNCTVNSGDLLVDVNCDSQTAMKTLVDGFQQLPKAFGVFGCCGSCS
jgi:hypothetical protein